MADAISPINQSLAKISQTDHFIGSRLSWRDFRRDLDLMRYRYQDGMNYLSFGKARVLMLRFLKTVCHQLGNLVLSSEVAEGKASTAIEDILYLQSAV